MDAQELQRTTRWRMAINAGGSFLFLWYLHRNQHLLARPVEKLINDNTLVALALLVAESLPDQKDLMVRLIEHFLLLKDTATKAER